MRLGSQLAFEFRLCSTLFLAVLVSCTMLVGLTSLFKVLLGGPSLLYNVSRFDLTVTVALPDRCHSPVTEILVLEILVLEILFLKILLPPPDQNLWSAS